MPARQVVLVGHRQLLDEMLPRVQQVVCQTKARTEVIRKGNASEPTEFGKLVKLQEAENQVYREVMLLKKRTKPADAVAIVSYDEKPGMQAIGVTAPDLPPVPGIRLTVARDHEYKRHGTVSLLAGIDLLTRRGGVQQNNQQPRPRIVTLSATDDRPPLWFGCGRPR
jgi:hypothetical protein